MNAKNQFFLRTKLLPPRPVSDLLSRPRLIQKIQTNLGSPATFVTADAGCGKTTLVAEFIRQQTRQIVWYQLDYTDADPAVFLSYLCHGIKRFAPNFGEMILSYLTEASDDLLRFPERAVDLLLNEILETIEQPFILVLDDYHHIGSDTIVHRLVDRILQYSSDIMHLIVTARDLPPLAITRRRSQAAALVLKREDLLFTDDEIKDLFRQTLNVELKPDDILEYREKTQGWVTALQLVKQIAEGQTYSAATRNAPQTNLKELLQLSEKDIFDYFAEEVFAGETGEMQRLLMHLSLLEALTLDVCSQLFPAMHCAAALPTLVRRNVFLTVASDGNGNEEYRLHPLFRSFLGRRLRSDIGRQAVTAEKVRIAEFFAAKQRFDQTLFYLLEAEEFETAAQIIAEHGGRWIASGAITILDFYAKKLPRAALEKFPRALVYAGEVARLQGETDRSVILLNRAAQLLHENADAEGEAEALHQLASIARLRGDYEKSFEHLEQAEKLVSETSEVRMKCENIRGLCFVAQNAWTHAERQFRFALELAEKLSNERYIRLISHNLALPAALRGDFGEALHWFKRMFREDQPDAQLPQEAIGHLNVARMHIYRGELAEAETHLDKALKLCQFYNLKLLRGEIFETYGNFYREKEDFAHAAEFYERARKAYEETNVSLAAKELDEERAQLALRQNDAASARELLENLLEKRRQINSGASLFVCRLSLCWVKLAQNEATQIIAELKELLDYFHQQHHFYYEAQAALALAIAYFLENERRNMQPHLQRALDITARFDYDYWLRQKLLTHATFFSDENVTERLPYDLQNQLTKVVASRKETPELSVAEQKRVLLAQPVVDLTLRLLGSVEIYRDVSKPFAADAWTTRRARDIFCFIATQRFRRVEKDILIDKFWGEAESEVIEKNFHPTISHIRKALNSRQALKQNFLVYRDGAYQLNSEFSYLIDTEEFERCISEAEKAKRSGNNERMIEFYEKTRETYRGEFMTGVYDDWVQEIRAYFNERHAFVLTVLAKTAFAEKNWSDALRFIGEILRADPYREDVHCLAMKIHAAQGKRAAVKDQFEALRQVLKKELGVEPAPETRRTFQELFK